MATTIQGVLAGRTWTVDQADSASTAAANTKGLSAVSRKYLIVRDALPEGTWQEEAELHTLQNLPKVGDLHHSGDPSFVVTSINFEEGAAGDKKNVIATVNYSRETGGEQTGTDACYCEQWGWRSGSISRDLFDTKTSGTTTTKVPPVNSAGDPFDSVPQIDYPSPTFVKVFKRASRMNKGVMDFLQKVNRTAVTIGGETFPARTLRCVTFDVERIFGDVDYKYRYTVGLQYISNYCTYVGDDHTDTEGEIGWDVAVLDAGMRYKNLGTGELTRFTDTDEQGNVVPASLPKPLDGGGYMSTYGVHYLRFRPYLEADFPSILTSEP